MKKSILFLLCVTLLLQFSGCAYFQPATPDSTQPSATLPTETTQAVEPEPSQPEETTTPAPPPPQAQLVALSLPVVTETGNADNGAPIFRYTYQNISMIAPDPDVVQLIIIDFLTRIDSSRAQAESLYTAAKGAYNGSENWTPYQSLITYKPTRVDSGVVSLFGNNTNSTGAPHPETVYTAVNYDLVTGKAMTLGDILTESTTMDALLEMVLEILAAQDAQLSLYEGYEKTVSAAFAGSSIQRCWYFTPNGLCFYFTPYEIAPYSSGVVAPEIPYSMLTGIVRDRYFPAEQENAMGTLSVQTFSLEAQNQFQRFAEVVLDTDGEKVLLYTDHLVHNIRIETGTWSASGSRYTPQHTVFAASALAVGDAIMVEAQLSEKNPALRLQYESNGETVTAFLSKDAAGILLLSQ